VTAEQYEQQNKGMASVTNDMVRMLADGLTVIGKDRNGRYRPRHARPWRRPMASPHDGVADQGSPRVRKSDFRERADETADSSDDICLDLITVGRSAARVRCCRVRSVEIWGRWRVV
jgi:hypothetical protein